MSFEAESTMIVNHKHAFRFMSLYMSTQMKHVLRYKCEVETLRNVEVITGTTLNGRTSSIFRIFWVNALCHFRVIETMSHYQIRLQKLGERLILEWVVHHRPSNVSILSVSCFSNLGSEVIGKEFHVDTVVNL